MNPQVLIVGAGPTGLTAALVLARLGVSVRIVDRSSGPAEGSRALVLQPRALEFHRILGTADDILAEGVRIDTLGFAAAWGISATLDIRSLGRDLSHFNHLVALPQNLHERILIDHLARSGVVVERGTELMGFCDTGRAVEARLAKGGGGETVVSDFLIGADGVHSTVRNALGIGFVRGSHDRLFYVADVEATRHRSSAQAEVALGGRGLAVVLPAGRPGSMRLLGPVPGLQESLPRLGFETIRADIERDCCVTVGKVNRFSTYRVHHRLAESFRRGRVFIAGDAGHVHSPAGGQGLNAGIGDALNLAWKLAAVLQDAATTHILSTYDTERRAFAEALIDGSDRAIHMAASRNPAIRTLRRALIAPLLVLLLRTRRFGHAFVRSNAQIAMACPASLLGSGVAGRVGAGDRLPYLRVPGGDNHAPLGALDWQVHVYGRLRPDFAELVEARGFALHMFPWTPQALAAGIPQDAAFLVRPDGHVGLATATQNPRALAAYLRQLWIRPRHAAAARFQAAE